VGFSSAIVPERWRLLYSLNPMVGIIDGFRWALLPGNVHVYVPGLVASMVLTVLLLWSGLRLRCVLLRRLVDGLVHGILSWVAVRG
jgi:lipopolysaccharide transport system permease protein